MEFNEDQNLLNNMKHSNKDLKLVNKNINGCYYTILGILFMQLLNGLVYYSDFKNKLKIEKLHLNIFFWINLFLLFIISTYISNEKFKEKISKWTSFSAYIFLYLTGWFLSLSFQFNPNNNEFNLSFIFLLFMIILFYIFYIAYSNINKYKHYNFTDMYLKRKFYLWCIFIMIIIMGSFYSLLNENCPSYSFNICIVFIIVCWRKISQTISDFKLEKNIELNKYNSFNLSILNFSYSYGILFWYSMYLNYYYFDLEYKINENHKNLY